LNNNNKEQKLKFILASGSPRRADILHTAGLEFEVVVPQCDEVFNKSIPVSTAVAKIATDKNSNVCTQITGDAVVISADTIVVADGEVLGKPKDNDDARRMLRKLSGKSHSVFTGVCISKVTESKTDVYKFTEETHVTFRNLTDDDIEKYIETGDPLDKAGAYGIQSIDFVKETDGSFYNVMGLPIERILEMLNIRRAVYSRKTSETNIMGSIDLGGGVININTGVGFLNHMLHSFAVHAGIGLELNCKGDLDVDVHHTVEDCGIALGKLLKKSIGHLSRVTRFGEARIPMDEAMGCCTIDISNRPYLVFNAVFTSPTVGALDTQTVKEFFRAVAFNAKITLHINVLYGENDHHKIETIFKSFAYALKTAIVPTEGIISAKGTL
jgi:imidazoleglycerol-phosphate dehydratase